MLFTAKDLPKDLLCSVIRVILPRSSNIYYTWTYSISVIAW